jgi:hypothetical protein
MTLERRDGRPYYYRSVRNGDKVRKVYVGAREKAHVSHGEDVLRRTGRKARLERKKEDLERLEALVAPVLEVSKAAEILARAPLVAAEYHKHKGEYRRARRA